MTNLAIVVPTYNEAENLPQLLESLWVLEPRWQVIVVDDKSPDGTGEIALRWQEERGNLTLIQPDRRRGLGAAYRLGLERARSLKPDLILTMDADLSHDPASVPSLVAATSEWDVVIGSRYVPGGRIEGWGWKRKILSRGGNSVARQVTGLGARDCTAGFRCYRSTVLDHIPFGRTQSNGYSFLIEMLWLCQQAGFAIGEVPVTFRDRRMGASKISWREIYRMLFTVGRLRLTAAGAPTAREARIP